MKQRHYVATIARLIGPGGAPFFEVELRPPDRPKGGISEQAVRIVMQGTHDALSDTVLTRVRHLLAQMAFAEWWVSNRV
jgi:hypothetical protein